MRIKLIAIGETKTVELQNLISNYRKRLLHHVRYEFEEIKENKKNKSLPIAQRKEQEGVLLLRKLKTTDRLILLDEGGEMFDSVGFSEMLQKEMHSGVGVLVFAIGGAYGFSKSVYQRCDRKLSLSKMTFPHQMVRLFFVEQLYRAYTILANTPYHHD